MLKVFNSGIFRSLFFFFSVVSFLKLHAQIEPVNFRHYSLADGLSSYKVVKLLQDRFGFMWIATQDGLNKFDGKGIIIYNKSAPEKYQLLGSDITDMVEDSSRNMLWVITSYGGLNGIDLVTGTVKIAVSVADSFNRFPDPWLRTLIQNRDELWIGTYNGISIYNIPGKKIKKILDQPMQFSKQPGSVYDINLLYRDGYSRIWSFSNFGIIIYSASDYSVTATRSLAELNMQEEYAFKLFSSYQDVVKGQFLLATNSGIKRIKYDQAVNFTVAEERLPESAGKGINCLQLDTDNNLWFATDEGLYKKNAKEDKLIAVEDVNTLDQKKWTHSVNTILFDHSNILWLGTLQGFAIATHINTPFLSFFQSSDQKTKISRTKFIFPYNDSLEYVCAYDGFYRVSNADKNIRQLKKGVFWTLFRHIDGRLILAAENRLYVFNTPEQFTGIEKLYTELAPVKDETFSTILYWSDSIIFFGSENNKGVFEWDHKKKTLTHLNDLASDSLASEIVNGLYKDRLNRLWILSDNSYAVYDPGKKELKNFELVNPLTQQPLTFFFDICEASGYYWLASYSSGIIQLDDQFRIKNIISTNQGMNNAGVYKVFPLNDTLLLATSNNGLSKINVVNLSVSNYFESDGLHSNAFDEHCGTMYNGKIYAGGPDGFTIIDPRYISMNTHPPELYINKIVIETRSGQREITDQLLRSASMPRDRLQTTVYFSALNYKNPELTTYEYRIKEQQDKWVRLGNQNFVTLIGLSPGKYTVQVRASNEDGITSNTREIQLDFLPKWYQTFWFKALVVVLMAGILYGLYRFRIAQIKREEKARRRIASDLHDDIGSTLSSISFYSGAIKQQVKENTPQVVPLLDKMASASETTISAMSDIVWATNPLHDKGANLVKRMQTYASENCGIKNVQLEFEADKNFEQAKLSMEMRKNYFLIFKEAVNNALKYSGCTMIRIKIRQELMEIKDNGKGFDAGDEFAGNGLKNMQHRAEEINGKLEIDSQQGKGTTVILSR